MAILKFRIYWEEDETVYRDIAIKHTQTFFDLHQAILKSYEFDSKHQSTFYKSNDAWQMGKEISCELYDKAYKVEPLIMSETGIGTQIADPNQKFIYEYDFEKSWRFMVELINIDKTESDKISYPACVRTEGIGPSQYGTKGVIETRMAQIEEKYDLAPDSLSDGFGEEGEADSESSEEEKFSDDQSENDF